MSIDPAHTGPDRPRPQPDPWDQVVIIDPRDLDGVSGVSGPALAEGLGVDSTSLTPAQLVEQLTGAERLLRWCQAVQMSAVQQLVQYASPDHPEFDPIPRLGTADFIAHPGDPIHQRCAEHEQINCDRCVPAADQDAAPGTPRVVPPRGEPRFVEVGFTTPEQIQEFLTDGISCALAISASAADQLVGAALCARDAAGVMDLMAAGRLDLARVKTLDRELAPIATRPGADRYAGALAAEHCELTPKKFRDRLKGEVLSVIGRDTDHQNARNKRRIWLRPEESGMATLGAYLPAEDARLAFDTLASLAKQQHEDALAAEGSCDANAEVEPDHCRHHGGGVRSLGNLRADALMEWIHSVHNTFIDPASGEFDDSGGDSARHRRRAKPRDVSRVMLHLHMNATTLADVDDHAAQLMGYGPISADHARRLCENATLIRILTDPVTGQVTALDTPSYKVPKALRWSVIARDGYCIFPTCDRPAHQGQIDHRDPHPGGRLARKDEATGETTHSNLEGLCDRHHRGKTHAGWTVNDMGDGWYEWRSPTSHIYYRGPAFVPRTTMFGAEGRELIWKRSGPWYDSIPGKAALPEPLGGTPSSERPGQPTGPPECEPAPF